MDLSTQEKLLAAGAALYLVGLEFDAASEALDALVQAGHGLSSPEVVAANNRCTEYAARYYTLHRQYRQLKQSLSGEDA